MHFSLFLTTRGHTPDEDAAVIRASTDLARRAVDLGFDAIFLPDHHFTGYVPQSSESFIYAAYLAAQLPPVWFGFSVQTVPLYHPVRFAERVALLSQLTEGRILVGVGSGTTPEESIGFGIPFQKTSEVAGQNLALMERLWNKKPSDEPILFDTGNYKGAVVSRISPAALGDPMQHLMTVAARPASIERGAKYAQPAFIHHFTPPHDVYPSNPFEVFQGNYRRYREALEAAGHAAGKVQFALEWTTATWQYVHVAPTDEQAAEELDLLLGQYQQAVSEEYAGNKAAEAISGVDLPPIPDAQSADWKRTWCLYGSPETVVARLKPYAEMGVGNILGGFMGGPLTEDRVRLTESSLGLFAAEVMPHFTSAAPR